MDISVNQSTIFWPVLALMGWTFLILLLIPYQRFKGAFAGQVTAEDFHCGESDNVPSSIKLPNRIFMNLLEMPVLFYVLSLILFITHNVDSLFINLARAYFAFRVLHSLVYLTYNQGWWLESKFGTAKNSPSENSAYSTKACCMSK